MVNVIKLETSMSDPSGRLIPFGVSAKLSVIISDGLAVFSFNPVFLARRFAGVEIQLAREKGELCNTRYVSRVQKAVTTYLGKSKEEIKEIIEGQLDELNKGVKKK